MVVVASGFTGSCHVSSNLDLLPPELFWVWFPWIWDLTGFFHHFFIILYFETITGPTRGDMWNNSLQSGRLIPSHGYQTLLRANPCWKIGTWYVNRLRRRSRNTFSYMHQNGCWISLPSFNTCIWMRVLQCWKSLLCYISEEREYKMTSHENFPWQTHLTISDSANNKYSTRWQILFNLFVVLVAVTLV